MVLRIVCGALSFLCTYMERGHETLANVLQQRIACAMTEQVVDGLETVICLRRFHAPR
jgi:hypothetical protein